MPNAAGAVLLAPGAIALLGYRTNPAARIDPTPVAGVVKPVATLTQQAGGPYSTPPRSPGW